MQETTESKLKNSEIMHWYWDHQKSKACFYKNIDEPGKDRHLDITIDYLTHQIFLSLFQNNKKVFDSPCHVIIAKCHNISFVVKCWLQKNAHFGTQGKHKIGGLACVLDEHIKLLYTHYNQKWLLKYGLRKITHDLKSPLTTILFNLELFEENQTENTLIFPKLKNQLFNYTDYIPEKITQLSVDVFNEHQGNKSWHLENIIFLCQQIAEKLGIKLECHVDRNNPDLFFTAVESFEWLFTELMGVATQLFLFQSIQIFNTDAHHHEFDCEAQSSIRIKCEIKSIDECCIRSRYFDLDSLLVPKLSILSQTLIASKLKIDLVSGMERSTFGITIPLVALK